jgi:NodT family efflux transporter outer membrane factor (OMF) lipoprotein
MQLKKALCLSLPILITTGCSLWGPQYAAPKIDTPTKWRSESSTLLIESSANLADTSWWEKFNDPTLNSLIEDALANNNNVQQAIGKIEVAQGELRRVQMGWVPTLNLGGNIGTGQVLNLANGATQPTIGPIINGATPNTIDYTYYSGGLVPTYSLNIFQQIKRGELAKADLERATYAKDAVRLAVISQVSGSYFTLLALEQELKEQNQVVSDLTQLVKLLNIQYKYGYAALTDIQTYQEKLEQAKVQIPYTEASIVSVQNALAVLIDKNPQEIKHATTFKTIAIDGIIPVNLPSRVLHNRPDIMQAEAGLKAANADIGVATANFFPTIALTSPVGGFSSQLTNLFNPSGQFWQTQITAAMPILNLGLNALVKEAKGVYYVSYYNYVQTVRNAFADVDDSLAAYVKTREAYTGAFSLYSTTKSNYDLNQKNYNLGYISYPESLSSKITLDNTAITLTRIKLQELQSIIKVYQAMAGGYNYHNTSEAKKFGDEHDI